MAGWMSLAILFGFPFLVLAGTEDQRNFRCYIEDFIVKPVAKDLIDVFTCTVSRPNNRSFINCNVRVNRNIYELDMETTMDMILPNNHMRRLYNGHFNACTFLVNLHKTRLFDVIAKNFAKVFEGNVTCPVVANFTYKVTNWTAERNFLPSYVPDCRLRFITKFVSKKRHLVSFTLLARVSNDKRSP